MIYLILYENILSIIQPLQTWVRKRKREREIEKIHHFLRSGVGNLISISQRCTKKLLGSLGQQKTPLSLLFHEKKRRPSNISLNVIGSSHHHQVRNLQSCSQRCTKKLLGSLGQQKTPLSLLFHEKKRRPSDISLNVIGSSQHHQVRKYHFDSR